MAFVLPNPTVPTNGQSLDATPVLQNFTAIAQAIQSFDGSQIQSGSIVASALNASINPNTLLKETTYDFIYTGCVWSSVSALNGTMTSGTVYINGIRVTVNSIATQAFTANRDTYVDVDVNGNVTFQAVANNAASPSLAANSIRLGIVISGGAALSSFNQGDPAATAPVISSVNLSVSDSLGNLICPRDPNRRVLCHRQFITSFATTSTTYVDVTGLSAAPFILPAGRRYVVRIGMDGYFNNASAGNGSDVTINDVTAAAEIAHMATTTPGSNFATNGYFASRAITPSAAGARVVKLQGKNPTGLILTLVGTATSPLYLSVEIA